MYGINANRVAAFYQKRFFVNKIMICFVISMSANYTYDDTIYQGKYINIESIT